MKVAIISIAFPGINRDFCPGIERVTEGIALGLASRGADVEVITSKRMGGPAKEVLPTGVRVVRVDSLMQYRGSGLMAAGLLDFCASVYRKHLDTLRESDVIQIVSQSLIPFRSLLGNHPTIFAYFPHYDTPSSLREFLYLPTVNKIAGQIFSRSDAVIAGLPPNSPEIHAFCSKFGVPPHKIRYVHEGFDPSSFGAGQPQDLLKKHGNNMVLYVGPLVRRKGLEFLIRAMPLILEAVPTAHLMLVGTIHEYGKKMVSLVKRLGVEASVTFAGFVPERELSDYYSAAKVFAFPSLLEGYPLVVLEAMGSGTPVVATRLAPIVEQLGNTGITFKPGDTQTLADSIVRILQEEDFRESLAESAQKRAMERFTWSKVADEYLSIYSEFMAHTRAG